MAEHIIGRHAVHKDDGNSFEPIPDEVVAEMRGRHADQESTTQIVEQWFEQYFPSHAVSRDIILAVEELKKRLTKVGPVRSTD